MTISTPYPALTRALQIISDTLTDCEIIHAVEHAEDSDDHAYVCAAFVDGYINSGLVGWENEQVIYAALTSEAIIRAEAEGADIGGAKVGWTARSLDAFTSHLMGFSREITAKARDERIAQNREESS